MKRRDCSVCAANVTLDRRSPSISANRSWLNEMVSSSPCSLRTNSNRLKREVASCTESHLRRILASYAAYYNQTRTHLALQKDAPLHRVVQRSGVIVAIPILAGLHHQYVRI